MKKKIKAEKSKPVNDKGETDKVHKIQSKPVIIDRRKENTNPLLRLRGIYYSYIRMSGIEIPPEKYLDIITIKTAFLSVFIGLAYGIYLIISKKPSLIWPFLSIFIAFAVLQLFYFFKISLSASSRVKKMETIFPDVIQMMASNLRAGMTIDRAFILSARAEFYPLDKEMMRAGKDIATGMDIAIAFRTMSDRIGSEKIGKTISLIISGIRSGGNISLLLEQTATNMREKEFIEKRISSNVLMYVIFIFFAVAVGAPLLFGLSSILVEILVKIIGNLPSDAVTANLPFSLSKINISTTFITWFAITFILVTDILASLILGLVNKGDEKSGLRFIIPLLLISYGIFFMVRIVLRKFLLENLSLGG